MSQPNQAIRVFIAAPIPLPAKLVLTQVIENLGGKIPSGVRWVNPDGIHLTIKFLGDVPPEEIVGITEAMFLAAAKISPFDVGLSGVGVFPNKREPRVLWAGVDGDLATLTQLQESTEQELAAAGYPKDRRRFNPHLTLGRVRAQSSEHTRRSIGPMVTSHQMPASDSWTVESVELIQSHLGPEGATYTTLTSASLKGVQS